MSTLLKLASLPCFYGAIRYIAHGKTFSDAGALTVGGVLLLAALGLVAGAFWVGRNKSNSAD
ncbi:MAG TPA: hypothetical protein VL175_08040 [Pirellulales bacterium]|nr:hypothetical protein [Pirellulales bacterium]